MFLNLDASACRCSCSSCSSRIHASLLLQHLMHASLSQESAEPDYIQTSLVKLEHAGDSLAESKLPYSPDNQFWYPDGTIIVVAQSIGFRIYKGLLAEASEMFHDMFNNASPSPPPSQAERSVTPSDGCPVVRVSDTAAEIRSLLNVLLHGRQ